MNILDSYVIRARLWPALLAALPAALALVVLFPLDWKDWQTVGGIAVFFGLMAVLEHLGRERGFRLQPQLFLIWDGAPTTRFLRHRDSTLNPLTKKRYLEALAAAVPMEMPTADAEVSDPQSADARYESCGQFLRARTRKKDDFPLVIAKNVEYGFRRNCLGLRTPAIWLGAGSMAVVTLKSVLGTAITPSSVAIAFVAGMFSCLLLVWWTKTVQPDWVRSSADAYAEALLATCDQLGKP